MPRLWHIVLSNGFGQLAVSAVRQRAVTGVQLAEKRAGNSHMSILECGFTLPKVMLALNV